MSGSRNSSHNEILHARKLYKEKNFKEALKYLTAMSPANITDCILWITNCYLKIADYDPSKYEEAIKFLQGQLENSTPSNKYRIYEGLFKLYSGLADINKRSAARYAYLELQKESLENLPNFPHKTSQTARLWASYYVSNQQYHMALNALHAALSDKKIPSGPADSRYLMGLQLMCNVGLKDKAAIREDIINLNKNLELLSRIDEKLISLNALLLANENLDLEDRVPLVELNENFEESSSDRLLFKAACYYEHRGVQNNNPNDVDKAKKYFLLLAAREEKNYWTWQGNISCACFYQMKENFHEISMQFSDSVIQAYKSHVNEVKPTAAQCEQAYTSFHIAQSELNKKKESKKLLEEGLEFFPHHLELKASNGKHLGRNPKKKFEEYEGIRKFDPNRLNERHGNDNLPIPANVFLATQKDYPSLNNNNNNNNSVTKNITSENKLFIEVLKSEKPQPKKMLILQKPWGSTNNSHSSTNKLFSSLNIANTATQANLQEKKKEHAQDNKQQDVVIPRNTQFSQQHYAQIGQLFGESLSVNKSSVVETATTTLTNAKRS